MASGPNSERSKSSLFPAALDNRVTECRSEPFLRCRPQRLSVGKGAIRARHCGFPLLKVWQAAIRQATSVRTSNSNADKVSRATAKAELAGTYSTINLATMRGLDSGGNQLLAGTEKPRFNWAVSTLRRLAISPIPNVRNQPTSGNPTHDGN